MIRILAIICLAAALTSQRANTIGLGGGCHPIHAAMNIGRAVIGTRLPIKHDIEGPGLIAIGFSNPHLPYLCGRLHTDARVIIPTLDPDKFWVDVPKDAAGAWVFIQGVQIHQGMPRLTDGFLVTVGVR